MVLTKNEKYKFTTSPQTGEPETFQGVYVDCGVFHYHGGFDFFLTFRKEDTGGTITVASKNILNITPINDI